MPDLVSILIPVYNAREWVARAIQSALDQTWPCKEVIVLDDGSTDGSLDEVLKFGGRIHIERTPNRGQNASRNRLTELSRGQWLVYLDADDELPSDSIEQKMRVAADADAIYGSMRTVHYVGQAQCGTEERRAVAYRDPFVAAMWWCYPNTSSMAFRRESLEAIGGWDESVKNCTDYAVYLPLLLKGYHFVPASESWSIYRMWGPSQAVNINPARKHLTRLTLMRRTMDELERTGKSTPERAQAFFDASLGVIRLLHLHQPGKARDQQRLLRDWNVAVRPSRELFSPLYLKTYHALGFRAAETVATLSRRFLPRKLRTKPSQCVPGEFSVNAKPPSP